MRRNQRDWIVIAGGITLVLLLLALMTWGNLRYVQANPGGNSFLIQWSAARAMLREGLNPYSEAVSQDIQRLAYGTASAGQPLLQFTNPLYTLFLALPFALVDDFSLARALWMTLLEVALLLIAIFSLRLADWSPGLWLVALIVPFSIFWYHGLRPLINGDPIILAALAVVGALLAIKNRSDELAGVLLAFSTIKPNVVILLIVFVAWWALINRRGKIITWLFGVGLALSLFAAIFIPDWPVHIARLILAYPSLELISTPRAAFASWWPAWGMRLGIALTALTSLILALEWWFHRHAEYRGFLWTALLTLTLGAWVGIVTDAGNYIMMFPALIYGFALLEERWHLGGKLFVLLSLFAVFIGLWLIFLNTTVQVAGQPVQSAVMLFPLPAFLLPLLYWVRWWAVHPHTLWFDGLR